MEINMFEADITNNRILSENLKWVNKINVTQCTAYSELLGNIAFSLVHRDDRNRFFRLLCAKSIIDNVKRNNLRITIGCRIANEMGEYSRYLCSVICCVDDSLSSIKAVICFKKVCQQKQILEVWKANV